MSSVYMGKKSSQVNDKKTGLGLELFSQVFLKAVLGLMDIFVLN